MKKLKFLLMILFITITCVGCGSKQKAPTKKTLKCSMIESNVETSITANFEDNKITTLTSTSIYNIDVDKDFKKEENEFIQSFDENDKFGINISVEPNENNSTIKVIYDVNYKRATDKDLISLGFDKLDTNYNDAYNSLVNDGYTCE